MTLGVRHLNCATMCPPLGRLVNEQRKMVCHCLLVEGPDGLILVDTGVGLLDIADPRGRLGKMFLFMTRPRLDPDETAVRQIERLGFKKEDVAHIVVTHLDLDHAGGIGDFPRARVHAYRKEVDAARERRTALERNRYRPAQWRDATFVAYEPDGAGERWFGFEAVKPAATGAGDDLLLIPLIGHTRGHCGVALRTATGWHLHCGDAYFHASEVSREGKGTVGLNAFQNVVQIDGAARKQNRARLRELALGHAGELRVYCAHDPSEFDAFLA
jgi:glyoxylase-like metal-dependent hydrolase (beta-lactamase superfamily II)